MFMPVIKVIISLLVGFLSHIGTLAMENDLTIEIEPGERQCFHQYIEQNSQYEIEYQVIDGGELDINFVIQSPTSRILLTEIRKSDGIHSLQAPEAGDYMFCLDNTFSRFSKKMVFFEIITDDPDKEWDELKGYSSDPIDYESTYQLKLEDMRSFLDRVKANLDKSQQTQNILRVYESRDRSIQEDNFTRVNFCSSIFLVVMVVTGFVQVFLIRNLFADRSKVSQVLKMRT